MLDIAKRTGDYGEFSVSTPDGTTYFCTVNSESKEEAMYVVNTINRADELRPKPSPK